MRRAYPISYTLYPTPCTLYRIPYTRYRIPFTVYRIPYTLYLILLLLLLPGSIRAQDRKRARDWGIQIGVLAPGRHNAITDVEGVRVGHVTLNQGEIRTGVTAILPHGGNLFREKVPAGIFTGNGFGKLTGSTQVAELGNIETPLVLTNTLSVGTALNAVVEYTLGLPGNENVRSVNAVVGETNDGQLNDIRGRHVTTAHVLDAIRKAASGPVAEGNVGAGTGTVCFGFKGGIGTASRVLPEQAGGYTVGVLVQTNFGGVLQIDGVPIGELLGQHFMDDRGKDKAQGSCMVVVATDAPLDARNLGRLARRAFMGIAKTGGIASNGSGEYVIAFSTDASLRIPYAPAERTHAVRVLHNDRMDPLFMAAIEATEEAIINSLFMAGSMTGAGGREIRSLPVDRVMEIMKSYRPVKQ